MAHYGIRHRRLAFVACLSSVAALVTLVGPSELLADRAKTPAAASSRVQPRGVKVRPTAVRPRPAKLTPRDLPPQARLTPAKKIRALRAVGVFKSEDLDQAVRLTPRAPFVDGNTFMNFFQADVKPALDPPRADFAASTAQTQISIAEVSFRALPGKAYLVDCGVSGGRTYFVSVWNGSSSSAQTQDVPYGGGFAVALPAGTAARRVAVYLAANKHWALTACEVTPVG